MYMRKDKEEDKSTPGSGTNHKFSPLSDLDLENPLKKDGGGKSSLERNKSEVGRRCED